MKKYWIILLLFLITSCATYYHVQRDFNQLFENGRLENAYDLLLKKDQLAESRERFLYFLNTGTVGSIIGNYEESNDYFEKAYIYGEDYVRSIGQRIASYLVNPSMVDYPGEDHEHLMLLYYKALNFLKLGDTEKALIECRRLNIRLQQLSDRYKSDEKYRRDAFIHNLMGIIYDADLDYNNAFIAYRNAYDIYSNDYRTLFNVDPPEQLKKDLIRTAFLSGFYEEGRKYEETFGMTREKTEPDQGNLVFFWQNGLGPVKTEWSINFVLVKGKAGMIHFQNDELGFSFPFFVPDYGDPATLEDVQLIRVAFPKYRERPVMFESGTLSLNDSKHNLDLAQDINAIAFKVLRERMLLEFSKSLIRVALKKGAEMAARSEKNYGLAMAISLYSAITEKADTRNWQTLPHSIYYTRISLPEGTYPAELILRSKLGEKYDQKHLFNYSIKAGKTTYHTFSSLESREEFNYNPYYQ